MNSKEKVLVLVLVLALAVVGIAGYYFSSKGYHDKDVLADQLAVVTEERDGLTADLTKAQESAASLQTDLDAANASVAELTTKAETAQVDLDAANAAIAEMTAAADTAKADLDKANTTIADLNAKIEKDGAATSKVTVTAVGTTGQYLLGKLFPKVNTEEVPFVVAENLTAVQAQVYLDILTQIGVTAEIN